MFNPRSLLIGLLLATLLIFGCGAPSEGGKVNGERRISKEHPRLLGSRERLQKLAKERPEAYARVVDAVRNLQPGDESVMDDHMKMISMALV